MGFKAEMDRVKDGDTMAVNERRSVRLWGIDAPEKKQAYGPEARDFAEAFLAGKKLRVLDVESGGFGRVGGIVYAGSDCLNAALVRAGLAWVYEEYCDLPVCDEWRALQESARAGRVGLWADDEAVPPWEFRRK